MSVGKIPVDPVVVNAAQTTKLSHSELNPDRDKIDNDQLKINEDHGETNWESIRTKGESTGRMLRAKQRGTRGRLLPVHRLWIQRRQPISTTVNLINNVGRSIRATRNLVRTIVKSIDPG